MSPAAFGFLLLFAVSDGCAKHRTTPTITSTPPPKQCPPLAMINVALQPSSYYIPVSVPNKDGSCSEGETLFVLQGENTTEAKKIFCDGQLSQWKSEAGVVGNETHAYATCVKPRCEFPKVVKCTAGKCLGPEVLPRLEIHKGGAFIECPKGNLFINNEDRAPAAETVSTLSCYYPDGEWTSHSDADYEGSRISFFCAEESESVSCGGIPGTSVFNASFCPPDMLCSFRAYSISTARGGIIGCVSPDAQLYLQTSPTTSVPVTSIACDFNVSPPVYSVFNASTNVGAVRDGFGVVTCAIPMCKACRYLSGITNAENSKYELPEGFIFDFTAVLERILIDDCFSYTCSGGSNATKIIYFEEIMASPSGPMIAGLAAASKTLNCNNDAAWATDSSIIPRSKNNVKIFCGKSK